jgi:hypothetical protein
MATEHEHDAMPPVVKTQMLIRRSAEIQPAGEVAERLQFVAHGGRRPAGDVPGPL